MFRYCERAIALPYRAISSLVYGPADGPAEHISRKNEEGKYPWSVVGHRRDGAYLRIVFQDHEAHFVCSGQTTK